MNTEDLLKIINESKSFKELKEKLKENKLKALTNKIFECGKDKYVTSFLYKKVIYQVVFSKYYNTYIIDSNEPNILIGRPSDSALFKLNDFDQNSDAIINIIGDHSNDLNIKYDKF